LIALHVLHERVFQGYLDPVPHFATDRAAIPPRDDCVPAEALALHQTREPVPIQTLHSSATFEFLDLSQHQIHLDLIFRPGVPDRPGELCHPVAHDRSAGPCHHVRRVHRVRREMFVPYEVLFPDGVIFLHAEAAPLEGPDHPGLAFRCDRHDLALNLLREPILDRRRRPGHHFRNRQREPAQSNLHPVALLHFCLFEEACAMICGLVPLVQIDLPGLFQRMRGKQVPGFRNRLKLVASSFPRRCPWAAVGEAIDLHEHCLFARSCLNRPDHGKQLVPSKAARPRLVPHSWPVAIL